MSVKEYEGLMSFVAFYQKYKPVLVAKDITVRNREHGYAGTLDYVCLILPQFADKDVPAGLWLIDFKTAKGVWPSSRIQVSAYKKTPEVEALMKGAGVTEIQLGILQLGYEANKRGWKVTPVEDQFDLFMAARLIWANETAGVSVKQKDYPLALSLVEEEEVLATGTTD